MLIGQAKCLEEIITSFVDNGKRRGNVPRINDLDLRPVRVRNVNCSYIRLWHSWRNRRLFYRYRPSHGDFDRAVGRQKARGFDCARVDLCISASRGDLSRRPTAGDLSLTLNGMFNVRKAQTRRVEFMLAAR
jgi:hypothetical protein